MVTSRSNSITHTHTRAPIFFSHAPFFPLWMHACFFVLYRVTLTTAARCHGGDEGAVFFRPHSLLLGAFSFTVVALRAVRDDVAYYSVSHLFLVNLTSTMTHVWWRCHGNRRVELYWREPVRTWVTYESDGRDGCRAFCALRAPFTIQHNI